MSLYRRADGVAPVKIASYPRRRRSAVAGARLTPPAIVRAFAAHEGADGDVCYADFFVAPDVAVLEESA